MIINKRKRINDNPCTETFESAAFSDGRILYDGSGSPDIYTYQYYITDHLGSTRMVVDDQGTPVEAVNYMPYGSMQPVDIALNPDIAVREKFTGKEFDREGAGYGVTEIAIALDFPVPASNEATPNRMEVYYSNAPDDVSKADVVPVQIYGSNGYGRFTASLPNMESRTISKVRFFFENDTRSCTVADINEVASVDAKVTISRTFTAVSEFTGVKQKSFLTYQRTAGENGFYLAGLGQYYFGARYYDPEIGGWLSCDKAGQFWSGYGYGNNPVMYVDADGNWFGADDCFAAAIGFAVGYVGYGLKTGNWGGRALVYGGISAGAAWLTLSTGGAAIATAGSLWDAVGYGALSGLSGGAFTGAATYTEQAAYDNGKYSLSNLKRNWDIGEFTTSAFTGATTGMVSGAVGAGFSYGAKEFINKVGRNYNESKFSDDNNRMNGYDKIVKKYKLQKDPIDNFVTEEIDPNLVGDDIVTVGDLTNGTVRGNNGVQNLVAKLGFHEGKNFRFPGGLHTEWVMERGGKMVLKAHYDFFDAATFGGFFGHNFLEVGWNGVVSGGFQNIGTQNYWQNKYFEF